MAFEEIRIRFSLNDVRQRKLYERLLGSPKGSRSDEIRDVLYQHYFEQSSVEAVGPRDSQQPDGPGDQISPQQPTVPGLVLQEIEAPPEPEYHQPNRLTQTPTGWRF